MSVYFTETIHTAATWIRRACISPGDSRRRGRKIPFIAARMWLVASALKSPSRIRRVRPSSARVLRLRRRRIYTGSLHARRVCECMLYDEPAVMQRRLAGRVQIQEEEVTRWATRKSGRADWHGKSNDNIQGARRDNVMSVMVRRIGGLTTRKKRSLRSETVARKWPKNGDAIRSVVSN